MVFPCMSHRILVSSPYKLVSSFILLPTLVLFIKFSNSIDLTQTFLIILNRTIITFSRRPSPLPDSFSSIFLLYFILSYRITSTSSTERSTNTLDTAVYSGHESSWGVNQFTKEQQKNFKNYYKLVPQTLK